MMRWIFLSTIVFGWVSGLSLAQAQHRPAGPRIVWQVENPFRLFTEAGDTQLHRTLFNALDDRERETPVLAIERRLAGRFPAGWAKTAFRKTCWQQGEHLYGACRKANPYIRPKHHRVELQLDNAGFEPGDCEWTITVRKGAGRKRRNTTRARIACDETLTVTIPYPGGAIAKVRTTSGDTLTARIKVRDIFVVGLGDSFASGEGNPDQPVRFSRDRTASYGFAPGKRPLDGYPVRVGAWNTLGDNTFSKNDARWFGQACHRSLYAYQTRVALQLAIEDPHRAVTFVHFACAGAEVTSGLFVKYKGNEWVPSPPRVPQISSVAEAQCGRRPVEEDVYPHAYTIQGKLPILQDMFLKRCPRKTARRIDLMLISIGGNDIGFSRLVANAVLPDKTTLRRLSGWMGTVYGPQEAAPFLKELPLRYKALNRALHGLLHIPWKQSDRIVLTGYPPMSIFNQQGNVCPDGQAGMEVFPEFRLSARKVQQGEDVAASLNKVMRRAARRHGWSFVESHRRAFRGHGLCAGIDQIESGAADDLRLPMKRNGRWIPFAPDAYRPYASRLRWFRTPNDAYMTANYHVKRSIARKVLGWSKLQWFQVVIASTYSGAFHPTAEGHAAMADAVLPTARKILNKYGK